MLNLRPEGEGDIFRDHDFVLEKGAEQIAVQGRREKRQRGSVFNFVMREAISEAPDDVVTLAKVKPVLKIQVVSVEIVEKGPGRREIICGNRIGQMGSIVVKLQAEAGILRENMRPAPEHILTVGAGITAGG